MNLFVAILKALFGNWQEAVDDMDYMFYRDRFYWNDDKEETENE